MKNLIFSISLLLLINELISAQTISPGNNSEYCPKQNYTFTVTIPGTDPFVWDDTNTSVISGPYQVSTSNGVTTFKFDGKFADINTKQTFRVNYTNSDNQSIWYEFPFDRVKSMFYGICDEIIYPAQTSILYPNPSSITAPLGQIVTQQISFTTAKFKSVFPSSGSDFCFGSIVNYDYLAPAGWKINGVLSNGTNRIVGSNNATIITDECSGGNNSIKIRALNSCDINNLLKSSNYEIPIHRTIPTMAIIGQSAFCSGTSSYSVQNLPSGSTVDWTVSPSGIVDLQQSNNIASLTKLQNGFITLTANVTLTCPNSVPPLTFYINVGDITTNPDLLGTDCIQTITENFLMTTSNPCMGCTYTWTVIKMTDGNAFWSTAYINFEEDNFCRVYGSASGGYNAWAGYSIGCTIYNACAGSSITIWHPFKVTPRGGWACNQGMQNTPGFEKTGFDENNLITRDKNTSDNLSDATTNKTLSLLVSPNPSSSTIKVKVPDFIAFNKVVILNSIGVVVKELYLGGERQEELIDVSGLVPGLYWVQANNQANKLRTTFIKL